MKRMYDNLELEIGVLRKALLLLPTAGSERHIISLPSRTPIATLTHYDPEVEAIKLAVEERIERLEALR